MLKLIEEFGKHVGITGFKNVKIDNAESWLGTMSEDRQQRVAVQFFDADLIATWEHLYFAAINALSAFKSGRNISKNIAVEMMVYASAQRQIKKAIAFIGVKRGVVNVAVTIMGEAPARIQAALSAITKQVQAEPDESVLKLSASKVARIRDAFGITETEIAAVTEKNDVERALVDLVLERMALLATRL